jgi:hypothetical protein
VTVRLLCCVSVCALLAGCAEPAISVADAGGTVAAADAGPSADCLPGAATEADVRNCGACGNVCAAPSHATARCVAGRCTRGPCEAGFFDFDGPATAGCEARCVGRSCTLGDGTTVTVQNDPLPETGLTASAFATSSSFGTFVQTSPGHTNIAILGESTPTSAGTVEQKSAHHRHVAGFNAVQTP